MQPISSTYSDTLALGSCPWLSHLGLHQPAAWASSGTRLPLLLGILDLAPVAPWSPWWGFQPPSWPCQLLATLVQTKLDWLARGLWGVTLISCTSSALLIRPYGSPRRSVSWLLPFTEEETRAGQVGPLPTQEVAIPGFEHSL